MKNEKEFATKNTLGN